MSIQLSKGKKGKFRASGLEFEIIDASRPGVTEVRFRHERQTHVLGDNALHDAADEIADWGVPPEPQPKPELSPGFCCFI